MTTSLFIMFLANIILFIMNGLIAYKNNKDFEDLINLTDAQINVVKTFDDDLSRLTKLLKGAKNEED